MKLELVIEAIRHDKNFNISNNLKFPLVNKKYFKQPKSNSM